MAHRSPLLAAVVLALFAGHFSSAESREQEELAMTIGCKPPSFKARKPMMIVSGSVALPDGVALKVTLKRLVERYVGVRIDPAVEGVGSGLAEVIGKKFVYENEIEGPGKYTVQVDLLDEDQRKSLIPDVKKRAGAKRTWQFELLNWGDDLATEIGPRLAEITLLAKDTMEMVKKFEAACKSQEEWEANQKELVKENGKLMTKLDSSLLKAYYPAAVANLYYTVRNIQGTAPYFIFKNGKFSGGKSYHADNQEMKTFRQEAFTYDNLKRYADESIPVAGREFSLWIVKDLRRSAGTMRPALAETLKAQKTAVGVDLFADRLEKATIADLDALEAEIRAVKGAKGEPEKKEEKK